MRSKKIKKSFFRLEAKKLLSAELITIKGGKVPPNDMCDGANCLACTTCVACSSTNTF